MQYKRVKLAGQSYFFTVNLENRSTQLLTDNIQLLRNAVRDVKRKHPFTILKIIGNAVRRQVSVSLSSCRSF